MVELGRMIRRMIDEAGALLPYTLTELTLIGQIVLGRILYVFTVFNKMKEGHLEGRSDSAPAM
ncbi:hypothetical protein NX871_12945 [Burkholderia thailandensis]|uniref:Gp51 n=2 Tax=root TaxID=1 RepID=Q8W6P9_9CAUD|nr:MULTISPECIES: hypothetical protein [pseudomallei group]NP_536408.1 hypothetical protein phiE125p52 [Burkholderia phage phiE125]AAL40325.1 gp51 [Burkholderia phage phiE125]MCS6470857.1 hypothetical protein [Burkholderia thailandensis]MUV28958.1 hypothetical protein [Burkholderia thailandensis]